MDLPEISELGEAGISRRPADPSRLAVLCRPHPCRRALRPTGSSAVPAGTSPTAKRGRLAAASPGADGRLAPQSARVAWPVFATEEIWR